MALFLAMDPCAPAYAEEPREYKIEAVYLYNFFNYITWPGYATPQELRDATICLYDGDPIEPYLAYVQHRMASERNLTIRSIDEGDPAKGCNILFTRRLLSRRTAESLTSQTLVVLESNDPLDKGEMIELYHNNGRILIRLNNGLLQRNGFQVSSRLQTLVQR